MFRHQRIEYAATFIEAYQRLPQATQKKTNRQLQLLVQDITYPSLHIHKMTDMGCIWEGRIDYSTRFTFERRGVVIYLGNHGIYLNP